MVVDSVLDSKITHWLACPSAKKRMFKEVATAMKRVRLECHVMTINRIGVVWPKEVTSHAAARLCAKAANKHSGVVVHRRPTGIQDGGTISASSPVQQPSAAPAAKQSEVKDV